MAFAKRTGFAFIDVYLCEIISKFVYLSRDQKEVTAFADDGEHGVQRDIKELFLCARCGKRFWQAKAVL
jgi:hypothetical protein